MKVKTMKTRILNTSVCLMLVISTVLLGFAGTVGAALPGTPSRPNGPTEGSNNVALQYTVSPVFAQSSHNVSYLFDWGDTTNTTVGPYPGGTGPVVAFHAWTANGVYQVKVQAKDYDTGLPTDVSAFSLPLNVTIVNLVTPQMPDGPTAAAINELCEFSIPAIIASYGHDVLYLFNWSDGYTTYWIGPHPSGWDFPVEASHGWDTKGTYQVRVKAKDNITRVESAWSPPLNITIGVSGPQFAITGISGGFGVSASIKNNLAPSKYVNYTIEISGGLLFFHVHKYYNGTVYIQSGTTVSISTPAFFALGPIKITVTAICGGETLLTKTYNAKVLLFYVTNIQEV